MSDDQLTATIRVFEPCDCRACAADKPWFSCEQIDERHIITFRCSPIDLDDPTVPHPSVVADVRAEYPHATLVYLDLN